jgi:hypothetical protein
MVTAQVGEVPEQAPPQLVKLEPLEADAVKVTTASLTTLAVQVVPQLIPPPETVPVPLPDLVTVKA